MIYFYQIKKNSLEKANGGIGIVPYVYGQARDYYYNLWKVQQCNSKKDLNDFLPQTKKITIVRPRRRIKERKEFNFLNEEVD